jgi:hypothetical protein
MARVRYPFILCYKSLDGQEIKFAQEDWENDDFERVDDQLAATVYTNLKMFKKGFMVSPTEYVKHFNENVHRWNAVELIYVGE